MKIDFRQGIIQYQQPTFLNVNVSSVDLVVGDTPTVFTIADHTVNYLFVELNSVANAWSPIVPGVDQWLYWDIDQFTARRTFGITTLKPLVQLTTPQSPATDQHWFDLTVNKMKVWSGFQWIEKIRVFACELSGGTIPNSVSINAPTSFAGTQVGIQNEAFAGEIMFDPNTGAPFRTPDGKFLTSETPLSTQNISSSSIKTAALLIEATAQTAMTAMTVVKFVDFGVITHADQFTSQMQQFGIIEQSVVQGDNVNVVTAGIVTSDLWNWPTVNAYVYSDANGVLTTSPPITAAVPIGTVLDKQSILIGAPQVTLNNSTGQTVQPASTTALGIVKLSTAPLVGTNPIAVGDNDTRVVNAVQRTGDTMSGFLTLNANPVNNLHAATKQYVDSVVVPPVVTFPLTAPDGTPTAPSYSFENSTGSGLWLDSAAAPRTLNASVNGTNVLSLSTGVTITTINDYVKTSNGNFTALGDAQTLTTIMRAQTTTNVATSLFVDGPGGTSRLVLPNNSTWRFNISVIARRIDSAGENAAFTVSGAISRDASAATTALVGSIIKTIEARTSPAWDITIAADSTNGALNVLVTGENTKTIRWVAQVSIVQVTS